MLDLNNLKMNVLVSMVNELGGNATMKTFSQRSKAVDRLNKMASEQNVLLEEKFDDEGNLRPAKVVKPEKKAEPAKAVEPEKKAKPVKAVESAEVPKPPKAPSIRSVAEALLLEVVGIDENKRKVGHSYATVLAMVLEKYPQAKTTVACLRWYAVHMRERNVMPPNRPRDLPAKAPAANEEPKAA